MADVIVVGGGVAGLCGACSWHATGTEVRLLERDPEPPPASRRGVGRWERRGVNQFSMLHFFLPRFRELIEAELPDLVAALEADGALRINSGAGIPDEVTGGARPGDERFDSRHRAPTDGRGDRSPRSRPSSRGWRSAAVRR